MPGGLHFLDQSRGAVAGLQRQEGEVIAVFLVHFEGFLYQGRGQAAAQEFFSRDKQAGMDGPLGPAPELEVRQTCNQPSGDSETLKDII
jgi:hypothetical protein